CFDYKWPVAIPSGLDWMGVIAVAMLLGATIWALVRRPIIGFLGFFCFAVLAPSSSFVPLPVACVEYRVYLPLAALSVLYVLALWSLLRAFTLRPALLLIWAVALGVATFNRNVDYHSAVLIWGDVVSKRPENPRGHGNFG